MIPGAWTPTSGAGATVGILWQPYAGTSIGAGYRSAVTENFSGMYMTAQDLCRRYCHPRE